MRHDLFFLNGSQKDKEIWFTLFVMNLFLKTYNRILRYLAFLQKWTLHCKASNGFFFLSLKGVIMAFLWKENKCIHLTKILRINRKTHLWQIVRCRAYRRDSKLLATLQFFHHENYGHRKLRGICRFSLHYLQGM